MTSSLATSALVSDHAPVAQTRDELETMMATWRDQHESVGLVPTMGALHQGHLALVEAAKARCERVLVTIYVNQKQFGPNEDFGAYPRTMAADLAALTPYNVDGVWAPTSQDMYPDGFSTTVRVDGLDDILTGAYRPAFFSGIATVVTRLLSLIQPQRAFFGEKDFQQLQVIRRLTQDLALPTTIEAVPTIRESDGLAMASRNVYLSDEARVIAPALYRILQETAQDITDGAAVSDAEAKAETALLEAGFRQVDFVAARAVADLGAPYDPQSGQSGRLLCDAWLEETRLVDNVEILPS